MDVCWGKKRVEKQVINAYNWRKAALCQYIGKLFHNSLCENVNTWCVAKVTETRAMPLMSATWVCGEGYFYMIHLTENQEKKIQSRWVCFFLLHNFISWSFSWVTKIPAVPCLWMYVIPSRWDLAAQSLGEIWEQNITISKLNFNNYIITRFSGIAKDNKCEPLTLSDTFLSPCPDGYTVVGSRHHSISISPPPCTLTFSRCFS